ncbi:MAG TPA: hypothetical protein VFH29_05440, partial [Anaerolineales bacterium]|nr:hypothetical protein [Anaerolineales bacterium]
MDQPAQMDAEGDRQLGTVIATIIWASWGGYIFLIIVSLLNNDRLSVALTLVGAGLLGIPMILLKRGRLRLSGLTVMLIELGVLTSIATAGQGIRDMIVLAFPIILIFAGLALEPLFFRLSVGLTLGAVCWLTLGEYLGLFVAKSFVAPAWVYLLGVSVILVVAAFSVDLLATNMRRALERAQAEVEQRKRIEASLEEEKILLRTLIDSLPDRIYVMDAKGAKIISNTADWKAAGGKTMQDVIGKTDFETYPPELASQFWAFDRQILTTGESFIGFEEP